MIKVLHELVALDGGGVERLLYDYYQHMDRNKISFDFIINDNEKEGLLEKALSNMGCNIFKVPSMRKDMRLRLIYTNKIIKNGKYDIVHSHTAKRSFFILPLAKRHGVSRRISHSHIAYEENCRLKRSIDKVLVYLGRKYATHLFACGIDAAVYMWGIRAINYGKVNIMTNAVDADKFRFNLKTQKKLRIDLGVEGKLVIGNVGRFVTQKNHSFLLNVFSKVLKINPNAVLLLIGGGSLEKELKEQANYLKIQDKVRFLGVRDNVHELLNTFDIFVLPSLFEGFPVVLVEAQANGLPVIVSDSVTDEIKISDLIHFKSLNDTAMEWALEICDIAHRSSQSDIYCDKVKEAGYDILSESKKLQEFYLGNE